MRRGLTLIELLLVVLVVALLVGLLAPSVHSSREAARRVQCRNNLHQLAIAFANYEETHGVYPPAFTCPVAKGATTAEKAWGVLLLPFVEEAPLYRQYDFNFPATDITLRGTQTLTNEQLSRSYIEQYECPTQGTGKAAVKLGEASLALTSYQPCFGRSFTSAARQHRGICYRNSSVKIGEIHDGTSQTLLIGEVLSADKKGVPRLHKGPIPNFWAGAGKKARFPIVWVGAGTQLPMNTVPAGFVSSQFGSRHRGGAFFAFVDSQVRFISENVDFTTYQDISTRRGTEVIDDHGY